MNQATNWEALIAAKREDRDSRIPPEWKLPAAIMAQAHRESTASAFSLLEKTSLLLPRERELTENYDATGLLELLSTGAVTSLQVTTAFCKRAAIAQQLTNCLTEIFFHEALEQAKERDRYWTANGGPKGPFHGLPISVKDMCAVKGQASTLGFTAYLKKPVDEVNAACVDALLDGGAVLYCKTNVPQGLVVMEGENRVFGCTLNPHNLSLTAGGSTSGEGALVAFRGSVLGVGTDLGGSIRVPSLANGCFGFRPTAWRLPWYGLEYPFPRGWPGAPPTIGPHAVSARDMTLFCKSLITTSSWKRDPTIVPSTWRDVPRKQNLIVGLWLGDDEVPVLPPIKRALKEAAAAIVKAGHTVKPISTPKGGSISRGFQISASALGLDPHNTLMQLLDDANEEVMSALAPIKTMLSERPKTTLEDFLTYTSDKLDYREAWHKTWSTSEYDVLLCPASRSTAVPHGTFGVPFYTVLWNLLDTASQTMRKLKGTIPTSYTAPLAMFKL
ncbi:hypothetical protein N0V84_008098 [Fusarium piperis]|uniref:Amidase domain-containing protein n=1 Tax=Fusarium piperis TaxID=1435070 RepID=A0A9W8W8S3_9HYPO|nr:hypothetical protein N0V84_008098 [Fusarium piperis]